MKVLIACEYSGTVRNAFIARGHNAISCDLLPTEIDGPHYQGNVLDIIDDGFDMMIAHPPCTHLAVSGARWFREKKTLQNEAIEFVKRLMTCSIQRIAIENPIGILSSIIRKPDQVIQPWEYGHGETKATCLWLKRLPRLKPTLLMVVSSASIECLQARIVGKSVAEHTGGVAAAMAEQWGDDLTSL